jgi:hypothetical protein
MNAIATIGITVVGQTEIAAAAQAERTPCLMIERIQLMLVIAVAPEETAAAVGPGSELVEVEVEEVVHLVLENLMAKCLSMAAEVA